MSPKKSAVKRRKPPEREEKDAGYGPSHGYGVGHGGPSGPGDVPATKPPQVPARIPEPSDDDDDGPAVSD